MADPVPTERGSRRENEDAERLDSDSADPCPECGGAVVMEADRAEIVCTDCGLILQEGLLDRGPEWRGFSHQEWQQRSRVGIPTTQTIPDKGLTTAIDWQNKDAYGRSLSADKRDQLHRLRTWQERIRTSDAGESNLKFALVEINRMAAALGVPKSVGEVAAVIYRRALTEDLIRGRTLEGVATATVYAACRMEEIPRSLAELTAVSRIERKEIGRTYRHVSRELGLELEPIDPRKFVPRFCSELDCSDEIRGTATELIETTVEEGLHVGKSPTGYAAAAIYAASLLCNEKQYQHEIAEVAQVTTVTIRKRYQEQLEAMEGH